MSLFDDLLADDLQRQQQGAVSRIDLNRPLAPEEQDSMLTRLAGKAMSGLAYAGKVLNTPGRIIRGGLTGNPRELLNAVPFSDSLGLTDESQAVSGNKLLEHFNLRDPEREKPEGFLGSVGDALPGFAAEVATDPLTYLTLGGSALTKAGQAAKKLGAVPESLGARIAGHASPEAAATAMGLSVPEAQAAARGVGLDLGDIVGKPLGGLAGVRIPGLGDVATLGTGPTAQKIGQKLSGAYDWLRASGPGQQLARMFIPKYDSLGGAEMQQVIRELDPTFQRQTAEGIGSVTEAGLPAAKIGADSAQAGLARRAAEGWLDEGGIGPYSPEFLDEARRAGIRATGLSAENMARYRDIGAAVSPLESRYGTQHVFRGVTPIPDATGTGVGRGAQSLTTRVGEAIQREPIFDIPGGTDAVNALSRNPAIAGESRSLPPVAARQEVRRLLGVDPAELAMLRGLSRGPISPEMLDRLGMLRDLNVKARGLSRRLGQMPDEQVATGLFGNDLSTDVMKETLDSIKAQKRAEIAQTLLGRFAQVGPLPPRGAPPPAGMVPAASILERIGLTGGIPGTSPERLKELAGFTGPLSPSDAAALAANQAAAGAGFRQANANLLARLGGRTGNIGQVMIPEHIAEQALQLAPRSVTPGYLDPILSKIDSITTAFKALNTMPFPGNAVRNATTDYFNNVLSGLSPASAARGVGDILSLRGGPDAALKGLAQEAPAIAARLPLGPTAPKIGVDQLDRLATQELGKMIYEHQLGGVGYNPARELAKQGGLTEMVPGAKAQEPLLSVLKGYIPTSKAEANPLNLAGVGGRTETTFAPVRAMREANDVLADAERQGHFLERLRQGYEPGAAAREAHAAQLDYNLTDFEKRYMRRLFPFYSWTQANTPAQLGRLAEQPGGLSAQLVRLSNDLRQQQGFLPEYLGGGLAVPIGKEDETGTQRYLTRLDLPYEDALDQFSAGPKGLEKSLMGGLAQLNPLIKAPLEVAANRQFSSGRDLDELYSRTGVPLADQLVMNSPGARLLSTAGQLTDPRKDLGSLLLNLGTGVRLSDVDLNKQRDIAAGDLVKELLTGDQNIGRYEKLYVRPQQLANLSPQEIELMRLYKAMEQRAAERARRPQGRPGA